MTLPSASRSCAHARSSRDGNDVHRDLAAVVRRLLAAALGVPSEEERDHLGALSRRSGTAREGLERGGLVAGLLGQLAPRGVGGVLGALVPDEAGGQRDDGSVQRRPELLGEDDLVARR